MQRKNLRSIAYLTVSGAEPIDEIEAAAAAGLDAVGLRISPPLGLSLAWPVIGEPARLHAMRQALQHTGLRVLDTEVITITAATTLAEIRPVLAISAELGASYLQITSEDENRPRALEIFGQICDEAARFGLKLAFEFMQWRAIKTISAAADFIADVGRANAGIVLDTLHLSRSGGSPADVAKVPPERIFFLQLCDATAQHPTTNAGLIAEARGGRLYPGEGTLWLDALFDILPRDIAISLEVPPSPDSTTTVHEQARTAAQSLDNWLATRKTQPG